MNVEELAVIVDDLIEILHLQAIELEKLIAHVEQVTVHLPEGSKMSVIRSSLSGLHLRIKQFRSVDAATTREGEEGPTSSTSK